MNRHHRRAQASWLRAIQKLRDASLCIDGSTVVMEMRVHTLEQIYFHPDPRICEGVVEWARKMPRRHPRCLTCDHEWISRTEDQPPPAAFVLTRPFDDSKAVVSLLSAVCADCYDRPTLAEEIKTAMRRFWGPGARIVDADPPSATFVMGERRT
jgi:hypothetical protein